MRPWRPRCRGSSAVSRPPAGQGGPCDRPTGSRRSRCHLPAGATPDAFALFLFAAKDWQQSDFADSTALFDQFQRSQSGGNYAWINDYKPLAEKFLADYRIFTEWKTQAQQFTRRDQITAAVTALRNAQGKLQLRGRLNDAFKDEEAKLIRQLEGQK